MSETIVATQVAPVPNLASVAKPQGTDLTPAQQKIVDDVLAHFSKDEYELSVKEGDKKLSEDEKFWLVCERRLCGLDAMSSQRVLDLRVHAQVCRPLCNVSSAALITTGPPSQVLSRYKVVECTAGHQEAGRDTTVAARVRPVRRTLHTRKCGARGVYLISP